MIISNAAACGFVGPNAEQGGQAAFQQDILPGRESFPVRLRWRRGGEEHPRSTAPTW